MSSAHRILIDWISFTVDIDLHGATKIWSIQNNLDKALERGMGGLWRELADAVPLWELSSGRAPYRQSYRSEQGITIYFNVTVGHCLMEISGRGCDFLRSRGLLERTCIEMMGRVTRVDLAVDLLTETTPKEFLSVGTSGRFKSRGSVVSDTGATEYVGSRKSERYCRVYRYAPPHPRSSYLRTEFVFRKRNAQLFIESLIEANWDYKACALGAGAVYGFEHEAWSITGDEIPLTSYTPERRSGKTVMWMINQVAPAFKKLVADGVIEDPEQFIKEFFLGA